jgi:hypothetical protein
MRAMFNCDARWDRESSKNICRKDIFSINQECFYTNKVYLILKLLISYYGFRHHSSFINFMYYFTKCSAIYGHHQVKYCGVAPRGRSIERPLLINGYVYLAGSLPDNGHGDSNS